MTKNALVSAALIATLAACGRDPAIPITARDLAMEQVGFSETYNSSRFDERARLVIRYQQDWEEIWDKISESAPTPEVDFETHMVVLAAMGSQGHSGFTIALNDVAATQDALYVSVTETTTSPIGCAFAMMITSPVAVAKVERVDGDVQFIERTATRSCGPF
jgi:hypothetical protein